MKNQNSFAVNSPNQPKQPEIIDLRKILNLIFGKWYLFLIFLMISGSGAFLYLRYTYPTYRISSMILINEAGNTNMAGTDMMLQGFGLTPGAQNLDNQILILSSWTLIKRTLDQLPFEIDYYIKGRIMSTSYYPNSPIEVFVDSLGRIPYGVEFSICPESRISGQLKASKNDRIKIDSLVPFYQVLEFEGVRMMISPNDDYWDMPESMRNIHFIMREEEDLIENYQNRIRVERASREGSMLRVVLEGTNKAKATDFIRTLTNEFLTSNLEKKNYEANRIIDFIDEQLVDIADSLMITENKLQEFRSRHRVMDISAQGRQIIEQAMRLEDVKARLILESNYFEYLNNYLDKEETHETPIAPASMGIEDPLLATLIQDLSALQTEYYSGGVGEKNPLQAQLALKIWNTKQSLSETLQGILHGNKMAQEENQQQITSLNAQATGLPKTERQLLGIERKFNLNDVLYTYLLQQRAEAQIQKASNAPDNEIVDPGRARRLPVSPRKNLIYLFSVLIGIGIPLLIIMAIEALGTKITSEDELKRITKLPLVGHIPKSNKAYQKVVFNDPQDDVTEAFRRLRTRMQFFTKETQSPVILMTSSIPGEGKTFAALNLASAYSLNKKRTVLVGFDLRRPKLYQDFDLQNDVGISTYLIGKSSIKDIIKFTGYEYLDIITGGPIPPNPAELSASDKIMDLFKELRKRYDYIIVDSAPIGTISDSYAMASISDVTILLVRHGHTVKHLLDSTLRDAKANGVNGLSILVNDVKARKGSYRYSYNFKYHYRDKS